MRIVDRSVAWFNGDFRPLDGIGIAVDDPALLAGLGTFETIGVRDGALLELDAHLDRMAAAAEKLSVPIPPNARLRDALLELAVRQGHACGWLKLLATRNDCVVAFGGSMDPGDEGRPTSAVVLPWQRGLRDPLMGLKTLNYAANTLGLEYAQRHGAEEGIWCNTRGHLAEGCSTNLFVVRRRALYTAGEREGILPGVVRDLALTAAREAGLLIHEGRVRVERLKRADEAFVTSSLRAVRPLLQCDGRPVGTGEPGPVTALIAAGVARLREPVRADSAIVRRAKQG